MRRPAFGSDRRQAALRVRHRTLRNPHTRERHGHPAQKRNDDAYRKHHVLCTEHRSLLIEIREVRRSEPNRLYPAAEMRAFIEKPLRCAPAQRGFCTVELPAAPTARGDLFILFRAAPKTETGVETASDSETASGEAADSASGVFELPGLALCRQQSEGLFFAVESGGRISYSQVEGLEILPPYVSLAAGE